MKRTTYQVPELRDENDNIIQDGTFGKHSAFSNATNDGAFDYILNNLEALRDNINGSRIYVKNKDALTTPGDISAMYIAEDTGKWYLWDGTKYIETDNARKIADEAIAARDVAKTSEQNAKTSEQNAKTSESNAATSKQAAVLAAVAAANSAKVAATSEANAKTSETHAASSETNAASYLAQAKTIKEDVDSALGKITGAMKYAGSVNAYADLPTANRNPGDVYNVKTADAAHGIKAGENVAWNGTDWDPLGGTVDLSPYATNTSVAGAFMNVTYSNATLNFIKKDGSTVSAIVNNVAHATTADSATSATSAASATKATADANGNNIVNTYVTKSDLSSSVSTTSLTVSGETSVPTANAGNSSKAIANTEFVQGELTNYLPLSGGTLTGDVDITGDLFVERYIRSGAIYSSDVDITGDLFVEGETSVPTANAGNSSKAIANTEFVAKSIASLVNGAPDQLNTLNELAKALGNDANFSATIMAELAKKLNSTEAESTYATKQEARVLPGTVTAFSGTFKDGFPVDKNTGLVNKEWHLCDGTNGTPDLRNRFIYGGDGTNNGETGGEENHKLTEAEIPPLNFRFDYGKRDTEGKYPIGSQINCAYYGTVTTNTRGGGQSHNNMPPYYVLAYIVKL